VTFPTALIIGPMKAGTTWVQDYLAWRGDVCLPAGVKETFFFDRHFDRGAAWYAAHFRHNDPARHTVAIEVAPSLFHGADVPARVAHTLGPIPLVVTRRDPVARAWSHYAHLRRKGYTRAPLAEAVGRYPEILSASLYQAQIDRWRRALPEAPLTVLPLEDLIAAPALYAARLCQAVGIVPRDPPDTLGTSNAGGVPPSFLLARLGRQTAAAVRSAGGYGMVNLAKRLGLKRVFFGADGARQLRMTAEDRAFLEHALSQG
jgi:hypothetical protein